MGPKAPHLGSPFCHHEGRHKRWEFLNWCTFRFRSTPSSFFPTHKIGFGAGGHFCICFTHFLDFQRFCVWGNCTNPGNKKMISVGCWVGGALALRAQRQPYGPNDNPIGPDITPI